MLKNIVSNWSYLFLSTISVFLLYPFCVRILGEEQYGIWLLISSITGYFFLFQLGVPMANVRFVSMYYGQNDIEKLNEVVSSNFVFFSVIGIIVLIIGTAIAFLIDRIFQVPPNFVKIARIATIIATVNISLSFSFEVWEGILNAFQKFVYFNLVKNIFLVIRVTLTFLLLVYDDGLIILPSLLLVVTFGQALCFYLYIKLKHPYIHIKKNYLRLDVFKMIAGYSAFVLISNLAGKISFNSDAMVIGSVVSISAVVFFTIGNNFILYSMNFISGISSVIMPMISKQEANSDKSQLKSSYILYSKNVSYITAPICATFFIFGKDFITVWMGSNYGVVSGNILNILTLSYFFLFLQNGVAYPILMGTSKIKVPTYLMLSTSILNLGISIWWGKINGVYGVAWGTTVPNIIYSFGIIWYMCKIFDLSIMKYLFKGIIIPSSAALFFAAPALFISRLIPHQTYLTITLHFLISALIYVLILFFFYLDKKMRESVLGKIRLSTVGISK